MKQKFCVLLALLMLLTSGCAQTADEADASDASSAESDGIASEIVEEEAEVTRVEDDLPEKDLGGWTMRILSHHDSISDESTIYASELTGETVNDALYNRDATLKERFNCDFTVIPGNGWGDDQTMLTASVQAGSRDYDMSYQYPYATSGSCITRGILYNMLYVPYLNFNQPWWHTNVNDLYTFFGYLPIVSSDYLITSYQYANALIFNKVMAENYQCEDLYELVREGRWTQEKFAEIIEMFSSDLNGDGQFTKDDSYGFATNFGYHAITWGYAADELPVHIDKDGAITMGNNSERFFNTAEWLYGILYGGHSTFEIGWDMPCDIDWDQNRVFIQALWLADLVKFRDCDSNYGILPYPKYNEEQEGYYTYMDARAGNMAIPIDIEKSTLENVGLLMEALSCLNFNDVVPEYLNSVQNFKYARDPESIEMLDYISAGRRWDIGYTFTNSGGITWILRTDLKSSNGQLASKVASLEKVTIKSFQKVMEAYEELGARDWN